MCVRWVYGLVLVLVVSCAAAAAGCRLPAAEAPDPGEIGQGEQGQTEQGQEGSATSGSTDGSALPGFWVGAPSVDSLDTGLAPGYAIAWVTTDGELMVASPWWSEPRILADDCGTWDFTWAPDASCVTYLAGPEPGQAERFLVVPIDGGQAAEITGFGPLSGAQRSGRSPNGAWHTVELTGTEPGYFDLALIGPNQAEPLLLPAYGNYTWSPDSRTLAYGKTSEVGEGADSVWTKTSSLCLRDMASGAETIIVNGDGVNRYYARRWPVADELYYVQEEEPPDRQGMYYSWVVNPAGGEPTCLGGDVLTIPTDLEIAATPEALEPFGYPWPEPSPDGSAAIVACADSSAGDGTRFFIVVMDTETGAWALLSEGLRAVWSPVPVPVGEGD